MKVPGSACSVARYGQLGKPLSVGGGLVQLAVHQGLGKHQVGQLGLFIAAANQDIGRRQVGVNHLVLVQKCQRRARWTATRTAWGQLSLSFSCSHFTRARMLSPSMYSRAIQQYGPVRPAQYRPSKLA